MALTPGGPTAPPPPKQPRQARKELTSSPGRSVLRWGLLMGGLVIIADLSTRVLQQQSGDSPSISGTLDLVDYALNAMFFAIAGGSVVRETGRVSLAALAGAVAGLTDGAVVSAAAIMAPLPGMLPDVTPDQIVMQLLMMNAITGIAVAAASAWVSLATRRRAGGA